MQVINPGTKLHLGISTDVGANTNFDLISTYNETIDDSAFLISVPLKDGKPFDIDENTKLIFKYFVGDEAMIIAAYRDDIVKKGIRTYWKMRRVSEQRQFFHRVDERFKIALHCDYWLETWPEKDGRIPHEESLTLDVSSGGVATFMALHFEVGELCKFLLPKVGNSPEGAEIEAVAAVCWQREAPKGSPYKNLCGLQFRFANDAEKNVMVQYMANLQKVYKL
ncbi:MAG: flagellar brake protein [Clostridia bacterium]|nr:flagellar brake protein [Clostridia bacterium]